MINLLFLLNNTIRYGLVMKKIDKIDWFIKGLEILKSEGFSKITIENLCLLVKVTKGSFYHHFGSIDGYVEAFMQYWLETNTLSFIKESNEISDMNEREEYLHMKSLQVEHESEQVIRAWSYSHLIVKEYVQKVDKIRLDYLIDMKTALGIEPEKARRNAMFELAILVGLQQLYPDLPKDELNKIYTERIK